MKHQVFVYGTLMAGLIAGRNVATRVKSEIAAQPSGGKGFR
jgi:gamma-glutamylcyclotransferase (GGCT)/AIG2-like uncharacterized protein YtfP